MFLLLLAFVSSASAAVSYLDVSGQFDTSLERMRKELRDGGKEVVAFGTFPAGEYSIHSAQLGNFTTIRRSSDASLVEVFGRLSVQGGISLGEMVIEGKVALSGGRPIHRPRIVVSENFFNYNFWLDVDTEGCNAGVVVLPLDMGGMKLTSSDGEYSEGKDITYWVKHHLPDAVRQRITGAIADVFKNNFDFCNLIKK